MPSNQILVANIGSTSFKFRLFEMPSERLLVRGGVERIGSAESAWKIEHGDGKAEDGEGSFADYAAAIEFLEEKLGGFDGLAAVGFKPVMARGISGTQHLDETVLQAMEEVTTLCPAHNPPYVAAVRAFHRTHPRLPCIGTFETAFFDEMPARNRRYPVPVEWEEKWGIQRYGFHGASHRYVTGRAAELAGKQDLRVISCHLGGSSSIAAVRNGRAVASSWGMTPQSGLPQNNRVGDFDIFAAIYIARDLGLGLDGLEKALATEAGLKGMAGLDSGDMRDLRSAAGNGSERARETLDAFAARIRGFIGEFLVELNGADVIIFTGGIGENQPQLREEVCRGMDFCGLELDLEANAAALGTEALISTDGSRIQVRVLPTNEELTIARNAWQHLSNNENQQH